MTTSGTPQQRQQEQEAAAVVFRSRHHVSQDDTIGENFEVIALDGSTVSVGVVLCRVMKLFLCIAPVWFGLLV